MSLSECRVDPDCPALMSCLDGECVDPCRKNNPCQGDEECSVVESAGKTTVVCACPAGTITGSNGRCRRVEVTTECTRPDECDDRETCHEGSCQGWIKWSTGGVISNQNLVDEYQLNF